MKKLELDQTITVLANVGVILGIIFLAFELRQNNEISRAQTRSDISRQITDYLSGVAGNGELASIMRRAQAGEELTADEDWQYFLIFSTNLRFWENIHYQYRQGLFDDSEFRAEREGWRRVIQSNSVFARYWCPLTQGYSIEFVSELESLFDGGICLR